MKVLTEAQRKIVEACNVAPAAVLARMAANPERQPGEDPDGNDDDDPDCIDSALTHLASATDPETDESLRLGHVRAARDFLNKHLAKNGFGDADDDAPTRTQASSLLHVAFPNSRASR